MARVAAAVLAAALLFAVASSQQAGARPDPPASVDELLDGVPVVIPAGTHPQTSPRRVAMRIMGHQVSGAGLVSLTFYPDGTCPVVVRCGVDYAVWYVRAHDVFHCFRGINGGCRVTPTAYYLVGDRSGEIFGFSVP